MADTGLTYLCATNEEENLLKQMWGSKDVKDKVDKWDGTDRMGVWEREYRIREAALPFLSKIGRSNIHKECEVVGGDRGKPDHYSGTWQGLGCVLCEREGVCYELLRERSLLRNLGHIAGRGNCLRVAQAFKRPRNTWESYQRDLRAEQEAQDNSDFLQRVVKGDCLQLIKRKLVYSP